MDERSVWQLFLVQWQRENSVIAQPGIYRIKKSTRNKNSNPIAAHRERTSSS
jgi:hypothetical protein